MINPEEITPKVSSEIVRAYRLRKISIMTVQEYLKIDEEVTE